MIDNDNIMRTIKVDDLLPILDGVTDAVFIDDGAGHCLWCNSACEDLYQISAPDITGALVKDLEKEGIFAPSVTRRVLDEKREITIIHENKDKKKLLTTGTPIFNDEGKVSLIITVSRDITRLTADHDPEDSDAGKMLQINDIDDIDITGGGIISSSHTMQNVMTLTKRLASVNTTVLITGESGVGKGLIARQLHDEGNRCNGPFVTVNCGAIPDTLIESELFGYAPGAFTGSRADGKKGLFEVAQNGTIFLDEISELPLNMQVKLLRVIQEREITPVGGVTAIPIDVRIVSATNRDLRELVRQDKFREDLYYRLNVVPINVPPLRDRPEDILPLIQTNLHKYNENLNEQKTLSSEALTILLKYPWPGNVRELQNIIERLIITTNDDIIDEENLPIFIKQEAKTNANTKTNLSLAAAMGKAERDILSNALANYKSTRAIAKVLEVSQPTIVRKLHKYGLTGDNK